MSRIAVVSSPSLEKWDWRNPEKGIGGSETSHVRMAQGLHTRGFEVVSYAPIPNKLDAVHDPTGLFWMDSEFVDIENTKVLINYREPAVFDAPKPEGAKWWFVAQDVHYGDAMTQERRDKIDRYICLCKKHAEVTAAMYPELHTSGRLFISSNGIESSRIYDEIQDIPRNPYRIMYASSPDRGLMFILENWFRIKERVPKAELHVFYGFHNMEVIVAHNGESDWRFQYQKELQRLLKQPGVVWHDRVGQRELWKEWAKSNIWFYPTDFPETSCITSMEAQACGAIPVATNYWALEQNIIGGYKFDGFPQKSPVVKALMIEKVVKLLKDCSELDRCEISQPESSREEMMWTARQRFDWDNIVSQWSKWILEDTGEIK